MCGICGIWGVADDRRRITPMIAAMHHRGPDDRGMYQDANVALGMTRLAILDTSAAGHQPMQNQDATIWLIYNGEVYNFQSERRLLETKGYVFSSNSDTEVVLRLYEHYGDDFLLRLRGMFALAIYDKRRGPGHERLLLARDHLGIKPLLFAHVGGRLVFASELKALLASGLIQPEIDPVALRMLLTFGSICQPHTILRGVSMLLPAHCMIVEGGRERIKRYWSLEANRWPDLRQRSYEDLVAEVASVLEESVGLQLVSDVPIGAFLSGGVDSSLLVSIMARMNRSKVKTFSVGFEAEGAGIDESDEAGRTAQFLGTDHTRISVTGNEVRDRIDHIARSLDQPSVDGVNSYFVSLAAKQGVTVAISGTGGDELFAGYPWFANMVLDQMRNQTEPWKAVAKSLLSIIARQPAFDSLLPRRGGWRLDRARSAGGFVAKYATNYQIFDPSTAAKLLACQYRDSSQAGRSPYYDLNEIDELPQDSAVARVTGLCLRGYANNQLLRDIDAVSMAHSLEVRVPFLDPLVTDMALSLPDSAKLGDLSNLSTTPALSSYRETGAKRILIDVGRPLLPDGFDLQLKRGFGMPFDSWLNGPLRDVLLDTLSSRSVRQRGFFDEPQVNTIVNAFYANRASWAQPWLLMMVELWCRNVLDTALQQ